MPLLRSAAKQQTRTYRWRRGRRHYRSRPDPCLPMNGRTGQPPKKQTTKGVRYSCSRCFQARTMDFFLLPSVILLYTLNNCFGKRYTHGILRGFLVCHFNDLICPLCLFSYANILLFFVGRRLTRFWEILLFGLLAGLIWETLTPVFKPSSVSDPKDLLAYLCGSFLYWGMQAICL